MELKTLLEAARRARRQAYAPYSRFPVGAAVVGTSGKIYTGANVENASYGLTVCAERIAIFKAITAGESALSAVAVVTSSGGSPCGACRQVMGEFATRDALVIVGDTGGRVRRYPLQRMLPVPFSAAHLKRSRVR